MRNSTFFKMLLLAAALMAGGRVIGQTYEMIKNNTGLENGGKYLILGQKSSDWYALGLQNTNNRASVSVTVTSEKTTVTIATSNSDTKPFEITLGESGSFWTLYDAVNNGYLYAAGGKNNNYLKNKATSTNFSISIAVDGKATVKDETSDVTRNLMRFNSGNTPPIFSCYASGQSDIYLFKRTTSPASPTITVSTATLTGFTYNHGSGPSAEQSFTVSGSNLTANISLAAPTNYEISTSSGSGFGSSLTLTQSEGTVASTTIYVRLKAGLDVGDYNNENITLSSTSASDKTVTLSGSVGLAAPTATAATNVSTTGFTANWGAVSGADNYELTVSKVEGNYIEVFSENFDGFSRGTTGTGAFSTDVSSSLNTYTQTPDWTGSKVYEAGGTVKMGTSSALGYLITPEIDLSGFSGNFTLSFKAMAWSGDATDLKIYLDDVLGETVNDLNNDDTYTLKAYNIPLTGGTASSKIKFEGKQASKGRFFLEDLVISQGTKTLTPIDDSPFTVASTSKVVSDLAAATTYAYTVKAKKDSYESASSDEIEVTTGKSVTSAQTGNWSANDTWSSGAVPEAKDAITVGNGHTVTQDANDASCSALTIQAGGKLIVSSGKHLTVSGDITNQAGNEGLLLESDATGTASLIHSNAGVQATAKRYLTGDWTAANSGWHLISSPVAAQAITAFTTSGDGNGYDFYGWNEPTNTWMNQKDSGFNDWNGNVNFVVGRGYMVSYQQNQTLSFTGTLNASDVTISDLTKSGNTYSGWHLLGNPYASAIRWNADEDEMVLDQLNDNAKIWHEGNKSYSDIERGGIIPSAQGFMVQATANNAGIIIDPAARVHDNQAFYKNGSGDMVLLVAAEASGASAQESKLLLNSAATAGFDAYHDALFLAGYAPQFFSVSDNEQLSTNAMPDFDDKVIPFGFVKNQADQYIIRLQESPAGMMLKLTDKKTGTVTNLSEHNSYAFSAEEGDDVMRFELEMNALGIGESPKTSTVRLYAYNGYVYLSGLTAPTNFVMTDITGRVVMTKHFNNTGQASLNTGKLPKGVYVVTAITGGQVVSAKVVL